MKIGLHLGSKQAAWLAAFQNAAEHYGECEQLQVVVEAVDFDRLDEQNFSCILHKMCTQIALYDKDPKSKAELDKLRRYFEVHPEKSFESLDAVCDINDRAVVAHKLQTFLVDMGSLGRVSQPPFLAVATEEDLKGLNVPFPLPWVCKPFVADGVPESHNLGRIVREEGVKEVALPFVLQPFVNHDAAIIKVYVLGDTVVQLRRPSLPNVAIGVPAVDGPGFVPFGRISNPNSVPSSEKQRVVLDDELAVPFLAEDLLQAAVKELKRLLQVQLFGVDLIRDNVTGTYLLIDVNFCPGFYGVPNVFEKIIDLMRLKLKI